MVTKTALLYYAIVIASALGLVRVFFPSRLAMFFPSILSRRPAARTIRTSTIDYSHVGTQVGPSQSSRQELGYCVMHPDRQAAIDYLSSFFIGDLDPGSSKNPTRDLPAPRVHDHPTCGQRPGAITSMTNIHATQLGRCHCKCTFIDVGTNWDDSMGEWLRIQNRNDGVSWKKFLRRFGDTKASRQWQQCLETFNYIAKSKTGGTGSSVQRDNQSICWYGFEGNRVYTKILRGVEEEKQKQGIPYHVYTETVLATEGGFKTFYVETETKGVGSSVQGSKDRLYVPDDRWVNTGEKVKDVYNHTKTRAIGAAAFIDAVARVSDFVFLKLDVEAYEYDLLYSLLVQGSLCGKVDMISCEWHPNMATQIVREGAHQAFECVMQMCGIVMIDN